MIVDTSALLAVLFEEPHAAWVVDQLKGSVANLRMSTVNLAEALIIVRDRQPGAYARIEAAILGGVLRFVPPTVEHARLAAEARLRFPIHLGDCFAYALARAEGERLLTLDLDFKKTDVALAMPS
ncbi:MAG: type II toxin-antitoxin system VapC family toxin [Myxococcota bacterium]